MRENAAPVDVRHQHDRTVDGFGKTHVGDIPLAQIDLGRAARAFHENRVIRRLQPRVGRKHRFESDGFVLVIRAGVEIHARLAVDDHLRAAIARGLEQHGVQIGMRGDAGGHRLQRLSAPDLAAVDGHCAVERHVLRLERRDPDTGAPREPA